MEQPILADAALASVVTTTALRLHAVGGGLWPGTALALIAGGVGAMINGLVRRGSPGPAVGLLLAFIIFFFAVSRCVRPTRRQKDSRRHNCRSARRRIGQSVRMFVPSLSPLMDACAEVGYHPDLELRSARLAPQSLSLELHVLHGSGSSTVGGRFGAGAWSSIKSRSA